MQKDCGHCEYSTFDRSVKAFTCDNEESENYGLETDYNYSCMDFEPKEGEEN